MFPASKFASPLLKSKIIFRTAGREDGVATLALNFKTLHNETHETNTLGASPDGALPGHVEDGPMLVFGEKK